LTNWPARFNFLDTAEVETPNRLATSAKATPWVFTNPMAMRARALVVGLRRLPPLHSCAFRFLDQ
jgi:hypothetical protein